jgi:hypothetical protein
MADEWRRASNISLLRISSNIVFPSHSQVWRRVILFLSGANEFPNQKDFLIRLHDVWNLLSPIFNVAFAATWHLRNTFMQISLSLRPPGHTARTAILLQGPMTCSTANSSRTGKLASSYRKVIFLHEFCYPLDSYSTANRILAFIVFSRVLCSIYALICDQGNCVAGYIG